jgi:hypothetical protein
MKNNEYALLSKLIEIAEEFDKHNINIFDGRGRGRKQCPKCRVYIGVRHKICVCKHVFQKKVDIELETESPECIEARNFMVCLGYYPGGLSIVFAPRGKCPVKFDGDMAAWADKVVEIYYGDNYVLSPEALQYMMGHFTKINSVEYHKNKADLNEWIAGVKNISFLD